MTQAEAKYWKSYIENVITSRLSALTNIEVDAAKIRTFADRHMLLITGQQMLPQEVFRMFCNEFAPISQWQKELADNQGVIMEFIEDGSYVELTDAEMDAIFSGEISDDTPDNVLHLSECSETDGDGYVAVPTIEMQQGYIKIHEDNVDSDGYITD